MKISIITVTYNSQRTVEETIRSVLAQDFPDIEYIIVDGNSKDGTMEVVNIYASRIDKIISEKDNGLYDALNKGIEMASGDVIGMLHSDDVYADDNVISRVARTFAAHPGTDAVYGDLVFVDRKDHEKVVRVWKAGEYTEGAFTEGWMPPHPTFFLKKSAYESHGIFNTRLKLSADYELMLRMIHKHKLTMRYLPETIVTMKTGGISNTSFIVRLKANKEDKLAWKLNDLKPGTLTTVRKPVNKILQYFRKDH